MILSMTGYGKAERETPDFVLTVEVRSLNSKQLDLHLKIPSLFRPFEQELRQLCQMMLQRGKVELSMNLRETTQNAAYVIDEQLFDRYHEQLRELAQRIGSTQDLLGQLLRMPDVLRQEEKVLDEGYKKEVLSLTEEALQKLSGHREKEGQAMQADLIANATSIGKLLDELAPFEEERNQKLKDRLQGQLDQWKKELDASRFHQEVVYYLEKWDINEERVRLRHHLQMFQEVIQGETRQGRKLQFVAQEIGREINTIGSKCQNAQMQQRVVQMKDHLEQIKEQLGNIL